jgi:hypothetical protein
MYYRVFLFFVILIFIPFAFAGDESIVYWLEQINASLIKGEFGTAGVISNQNLSEIKNLGDDVLNPQNIIKNPFSESSDVFNGVQTDYGIRIYSRLGGESYSVPLDKSFQQVWSLDTLGDLALGFSPDLGEELKFCLINNSVEVKEIEFVISRGEFEYSKKDIIFSGTASEIIKHELDISRPEVFYKGHGKSSVECFNPNQELLIKFEKDGEYKIDILDSKNGEVLAFTFLSIVDPKKTYSIKPIESNLVGKNISLYFEPIFGYWKGCWSITDSENKFYASSPLPTAVEYFKNSLPGHWYCPGANAWFGWDSFIENPTKENFNYAFEKSGNYKVKLWVDSPQVSSLENSSFSHEWTVQVK